MPDLELRSWRLGNRQVVLDEVSDCPTKLLGFFTVEIRVI